MGLFCSCISSSIALRKATQLDESPSIESVDYNFYGSKRSPVDSVDLRFQMTWFVVVLCAACLAWNFLLTTYCLFRIS